MSINNGSNPRSTTFGMRINRRAQLDRSEVSGRMREELGKEKRSEGSVDNLI